MDRFVKVFCAQYLTELEVYVNNYARENKLNILRISYTTVNSYLSPYSAFVLFEKRKLRFRR